MFGTERVWYETAVGKKGEKNDEQATPVVIQLYMTYKTIKPCQHFLSLNYTSSFPYFLQYERIPFSIARKVS